MKKKLLIIFLLIQVKSFATSDTSNVAFNFNNLSAGNLSGQNGWATTKFNTAADVQVQTTGSYDGTNNLAFNASGPGVGCSANRPIDTVFTGIRFSDYGSKYIITYDIFKAYWSLEFGIGYDADNNGYIDRTNTTEKAIVYTASSVNTEQILRPNGSIVNPTTLTGSWTRIEISIFDLRVGSGKMTVRTQVLGSGTWSTPVNGVPLGIDTNATDKKNPSLWDSFFMHFEGAGGFIDNVQLTRITNSPLTSVQDLNEEVRIFQNPVKEFLSFDVPFITSKPINVDVFSADGKLVKHTMETGISKLEVNVADLPKGLYFLMINSGSNSSKGKFVKE